MICVTQRFKAEPDDDGVVRKGQRGDCVAACLASIFEMPIDTFPEHDASQWLYKWLRCHYPGITARRQDYYEIRDQAPHYSGYWIGSVLSERFRIECTTCKPDTKSQPPHWYNRAECPWCQGTGIEKGHHAVVMKGSEREWDPHPDVDWEAPLQFVGETIFFVSNPERLMPRMIPPPFGREL